MKRIFLIIALFALQLYPVAAFWQSRDSNYNVTIVASGGSPIVAPVMMAGSTTGPSTSAANYVALLAGNNTAAWSASGTTRVTVWPIAGMLSGLTVNYPAGAGAAGTYAISLNKNGSNSTTMTCNIPNSGTTCTAAASVPIAAGDLLGWQSCPGTVSGGTCTTGGTETSNTNVQISAVFTSTNNNESFLIASGATGGANNAAANYMSFGGYVGNYGTTESAVSNYSPTAGVIDLLYINNVTGAPGSSKYWIATLFHNGSATSLQCSMTGTGSGAGITTCNDLTAGHSVTIAATDTFSVELCPQSSATYSGSCSPGGTPATALFQAGVRFVPTTSGETILTEVGTGGSANNATYYSNLIGGVASSTTETQVYNMSPSISGGFSLKKLYVALTKASTGATNTFYFRGGATTSGGSQGNVPASPTGCAIAAVTSGSCQDTSDVYSSIAGNAFLDVADVRGGTDVAGTTLKISAVVTAP